MDQNESQPLKWPEGWPRTRFQDRKAQAAWKKSYGQSVEALGKELKRLGASSFEITRNLPNSEDSGIAVYFTLAPVDEYGWQEALGFIGTLPTLEQVDRAYRDRAKRVHPDGPTPDVDAFHALNKHYAMAKKWIKGERYVQHDKVIPCDAFKEQRWNVNAIRLTIYALRQIERCGSPTMMERSLRGFAKALITQGSEETHEPAIA